VKQKNGFPSLATMEHQKKVHFPFEKGLSAKQPSVATALSKAHDLALLSSLIKKEIKPVTKGITINKTGIILLFYLQLF
jgi:hypothetical protein